MHQNQNLPYGNGSPVLTAKSLLKDSSFLFCFGDDFVATPGLPSGAKQVVEAYESREDCYGIMAVQEVPKSDVSRYGIVECFDGEERIKSIVEKPKPEETTSNLAEFGRIVLHPEIFNYLAADKTGKGGELWLVDAMGEHLKEKPYFVHRLQGQWITTGDPLRYLQATFEVAMNRTDIKDKLKDYLKARLAELN